jgi:hypothetical protein
LNTPHIWLEWAVDGETVVGHGSRWSRNPERWDILRQRGKSVRSESEQKLQPVISCRCKEDQCARNIGVEIVKFADLDTLAHDHGLPAELRFVLALASQAQSLESARKHHKHRGESLEER